MPLSNISCLVFSLHLSGGNSSAIGHVLIICLILATGTCWKQKKKDKSVLEKSIGETVVWFFTEVPWVTIVRFQGLCCWRSLFERPHRVFASCIVTAQCLKQDHCNWEVNFKL